MKKWPAGNIMCFMALYKWRIQPEHLFPAPHPHFFWESSNWKQAELYFNWGNSVYAKDAESESKVPQLCLTLCDPMDCSLPGSSVHGMLKLRPRDWWAWTCHLTFWESQVIWKFMCRGGNVQHNLESRVTLWNYRRLTLPLVSHVLCAQPGGLDIAFS